VTLGLLIAIATLTFVQIGAEYHIAGHVRTFDISVLVLTLLAIWLG
jgi:hypothetical protein